jgi:hypothetical protein
VLGTAHTSAAGGFTFSFVTRSDYWSGVPAQQLQQVHRGGGPPDGSRGRPGAVPDVAVEAGQATDLGTILLP